MISKFQVGIKSLLCQGLSEPEFYGDLVYKLKKIGGSNSYSAQFIKIISHYKKDGYSIKALNAGLVALSYFRGSEPALLQNTIKNS